MDSRHLCAPSFPSFPLPPIHSLQICIVKTQPLLKGYQTSLLDVENQAVQEKKYSKGEQ